MRPKGKWLWVGALPFLLQLLQVGSAYARPSSLILGRDENELVSALTDVGDLDFLDVADVQAKSQAADEAHAGLAREVNTVKALLRFASEQVVTRRQQTVLRREHVAAATIEQVGKLEGSSSLDLRFTLGEYGEDLEGGAGSVLFSSPCWPPRGVGGIVILCLVMSFLVWEERSHSHRARKVAVELREARASTAKANGVVSALREELGDARRETARIATCKIVATEEALGRKLEVARSDVRSIKKELSTARANAAAAEVLAERNAQLLQAEGKREVRVLEEKLKLLREESASRAAAFEAEMEDMRASSSEAQADAAAATSAVAEKVDEARKVAVELREARASTAEANGVVSALRDELADARREKARVTCKIVPTEEALGRKLNPTMAEKEEDTFPYDGKPFLLGYEELVAKARKPVILGVSASFGGAIRLEFDQDGNAFGTACLVGALLHSVRNPYALADIDARLKESRLEFFHRLTSPQQGCVEAVTRLLDDYGGRWECRATNDAYGVALAIDLLAKLREAGSSKEWLELRRGLAIVARAVDVLDSVANGCEGEELMKRRTLCERVGEFAGLRNVMQPGSSRGLSLRTIDGARCVQGYDELFRVLDSRGSAERRPGEEEGMVLAECLEHVNYVLFGDSRLAVALAETLEPPSLAPNGLVNTKNTCAVNSVLQLLRHNEPLSKALKQLKAASTGGSIKSSATTAVRGMATLFGVMETKRPVYQIQPALLSAIYDGSEMTLGSHVDANNVLCRLSAVLSDASSGGGGIEDELFRRTVADMRPSVTTRRSCSCGNALHETTEGNSSLTVPMGLPPPGVARRSLQDLLEAKFGGTETSACHECQGLAEASARTGQLVDGLAATVSSNLATDNPFEVCGLLLNEVHNELRPKLQELPSCIREVVSAAYARLETLVSRTRDSRLVDGDRDADEATLLLLQGCLKKAGGDSALGIQKAVRVLESLQVHATNKCNENERSAPGTNFQLESTRLSSAPGTILFYLLRFDVVGTNGELKLSKLEENIRIPEILDMSPFTTDSAPRDMTYVLDGVIHHQGKQCHEGHYVAFAHNDGRWRKYDDQVVLDNVDEGEVLSKEVVILSYTRRPLFLMHNA